MMKKLAIALAVAALAPVAMAQSAGDLVVRFRAVNIDPANKDTVVLPAAAGGDVSVSVSEKVIPEVDFSYFFTPNIAAELILTYPQKHNVSVNGEKAGTFKHLPPTLTAQYHFTGLPYGLKPYVGAGINYTRISKVDLGQGVSLKKNSFGWALQAGVDYAIDKKWSLNLDIKKVQIQSELSIDGLGDVGKVKVDPLLVGLGVGYKF